VAARGCGRRSLGPIHVGGGSLGTSAQPETERQTFRRIILRPPVRNQPPQPTFVDHQALKPLAFSRLSPVLARFLNPREFGVHCGALGRTGAHNQTIAKHFGAWRGRTWPGSSPAARTADGFRARLARAWPRPTGGVRSDTGAVTSVVRRRHDARLSLMTTSQFQLCAPAPLRPCVECPRSEGNAMPYQAPRRKGKSKRPLTSVLCPLSSVLAPPCALALTKEPRLSLDFARQRSEAVRNIKAQGSPRHRPGRGRLSSP